MTVALEPGLIPAPLPLLGRAIRRPHGYRENRQRPLLGTMLRDL